MQQKIKIIYGLLIFFLSYVLILYFYGLFFFGISFTKKIFLILKHAPPNYVLRFLADHYHEKNEHIILAVFFVSLLITLFFAFKNNISGNKANNDKIKRGPRLLNARELTKAFNGMIEQETNEIYVDLPKKKRKTFSKKEYRKKLLGTPFLCSKEDIKIPQYVFQRHASFLGTTGVGKTTLIKQFILYANSLGEKSIILDINGELYSKLGREDDIILSPFDTRSHCWDFHMEKSRGKKINNSEFAKYLIPQGSEQNRFWWEGARTVFVELLNLYPDSKGLWNALNHPDKIFRKNLSGLVGNIIGNEGSNQDAGIIGTLCSDLGFLKELLNLNSFSKKNCFSVASWAQNHSKSNVFIIFSDKDFENISALVKIWVNLSILGRFESGEDNNLPKMNLIIDEIGSLHRLEQLPNALARLRKYGGKVILGIQSENQLLNIYGNKEGRAMKSNIGTKFIFRSPEEEDAQALSKFLGRSEVINVSENRSHDKKGHQRSFSETSSYKDIVLDSEIKSLADGHFYLKSLNLSPSKLRIRKMKWPEIHNLHYEKVLPRKALPQKKKAKAESRTMSY